MFTVKVFFTNSESSTAMPDENRAVQHALAMLILHKPSKAYFLERVEVWRNTAKYPVMVFDAGGVVERNHADNMRKLSMSSIYGKLGRRPNA